MRGSRSRGPAMWSPGRQGRSLVWGEEVGGKTRMRSQHRSQCGRGSRPVRPPVTGAVRPAGLRARKTRPRGTRSPRESHSSQPKGEGGRLGPRPPRRVTPPQPARFALKLWTGGCGRGSRPSRGARARRCCLGVRLGLRGRWEGDGAPLGPRAQGRRGKAGFSAEAKGSCTPPVPLPWAGLGRARPPGRRGRPRHALGACSDPRHSCRRNADGASPAGAGLCSA